MVTEELRPANRMDRLAPAMIVLMAALWGSTFFVLKDAVTRLPPTDLLAVRFTISAVIVALVGWRQLRFTRKIIINGSIMGLFYAAGQILQTIGLESTNASTSSFLTGIYVVLTAFFQALIIRTRITPRTWVSVGLAMGGLAILTLSPGAPAQFGIGEILTLACAFSFAGHIVYTGLATNPQDAISLTIVQSVILAVLCIITALPGGIVMPASPADWGTILYLAGPCGALAIFLQIWAQARVEPTRAAIIMSSEPIWATGFAVAIGQEPLAWHTVLGGLGMVAAMILSSAGSPSGPEPPAKPITEESFSDAEPAQRPGFQAS